MYENEEYVYHYVFSAFRGSKCLKVSGVIKWPKIEDQIDYDKLFNAISEEYIPSDERYDYSDHLIESLSVLHKAE